MSEIEGISGPCVLCLEKRGRAGSRNGTHSVCFSKMSREKGDRG
jgi:hypothetical protein